MKHTTLPDFLTESEIARALRIAHAPLPVGQSFAQVVADRIIRPNMARINAALGQENDPMFLAYAVEYVLMESGAFTKGGAQ